MSLTDFNYLKNDFNFQADRVNPKGLDYPGIQQIESMSHKIDITSLREHFDPSGQMHGKAYQDFIFEVKRTRRKNLTLIIYYHLTR